MQQLAIIELVQYEREISIYKPSHAGIRTILETTNEIDKNYKLKFSKNCEGEYRFCDWVKDKGGVYAWWEEPRDIEDDRYFPRIGDVCELPEEYECWCEAMTDFLLENGFKLQNVGNILHIFVKD